MGLTMSERKAVTKKLALEYRRGNKARKAELLDQVCAVNGWHRSHVLTPAQNRANSAV